MKSRLRTLVLFALMGCCGAVNYGQTPPAPATHGQGHSKIEYMNRKYGFRFDLPTSWRGFTILTDQWSGDRDMTGIVGPILSIRHPLWTEEHQLLDIPIMVFTHAQWRLREDGKLSVSAAPTDPWEIGRNKKYVFAIPPRFAMDFDPRDEEVQEVDQILKGHPLHRY
jgi:hypothetical protein